jgi:hypothetical protein
LTWAKLADQPSSSLRAGQPVIGASASWPRPAPPPGHAARARQSIVRPWRAHAPCPGADGNHPEQRAMQHGGVARQPCRAGGAQGSEGLADGPAHQPDGRGVWWPLASGTTAAFASVILPPATSRVQSLRLLRRQSSAHGSARRPCSRRPRGGPRRRFRPCARRRQAPSW